MQTSLQSSLSQTQGIRTYRCPRHATDEEAAPASQYPFRHDAIVRCIGPALEGLEAEVPLVRNLIERRRAVEDGSGLGISTDEAGHVMRPSGAPDPCLYAIGALRRASSWETTSVPDISVAALEIAKQIAP